MKRNKWQYQTVHRTVQGFDWDEFKLAMLDFEEGEVLLRKKIEWDVTQMRKYFHGPVLAFVEAQERQQGSSKGKEEIKSHLKIIFGPYEDYMFAGKLVNGPKSTANYTFAEYTKFLNDIDAFCMDNYGCGIPPAEQVE